MPPLWNPACPCPFGKLADELVQRVLSFLPERDVASFARTSTRNNFIAESPGAWGARPTSDVGLGRLLSGAHPRSLAGRALALAGVEGPAALAALPTSPALASIDLSGSKRASGDDVAAFVARHGRTLQRLVLDGVVGVDDGHVARMLAAAPGLRVLSLARCAGLTDAALDALAASPAARRLVALSVSGCGGVSGHALRRVLEAAAGARRLRVLEARALAPAGVCDALAAALAAAAPGLRVCDVSHADPLGVAALSPRAAHACAPGGAASPFAGGAGAGAGAGWTSPFSSAGASAGAGADAGSLSPPAPSPTSPPAGAGGLTDVGLLALARGCPSLRVLRVAGHAALTDAGVAAAVRALPELATLDVGGARGVGDATAGAVARSGARDAGGRGGAWDEVRLGHARALTDRGLAALADPRALRRVRLLDLGSARGPSDGAWARLAAAGAAAAAAAGGRGATLLLPRAARTAQQRTAAPAALVATA